VLDIVCNLDSLANSLENRGFVKEAYEIDVVANTIEASSNRVAGLTKDQIDSIKSAVISILTKSGISEQQISEKSPKDLFVNKAQFMKELRTALPWVNFCTALSTYTYGPDLLADVPEEELSYKPDLMGGLRAPGTTPLRPV